MRQKTCKRAVTSEPESSGLDLRICQKVEAGTFSRSKAASVSGAFLQKASFYHSTLNEQQRQNDAFSTKTSKTNAAKVSGWSNVVRDAHARNMELGIRKPHLALRPEWGPRTVVRFARKVTARGRISLDSSWKIAIFFSIPPSDFRNAFVSDGKKKKTLVSR